MPDVLASAVAHHRQGRLPEAERLYRQALEADPRNAEALQLLGLLFHHNGDHAEAARLIRQAIAIAPDKAGYHFNLGVVLAAAGEVADAEAAYRDALARAPRDVDAHVNLGLLVLRGDRAEEALAAFEAALEADTARIDARLGRGECFYRLGQPERAEADFRAVLAAAPDHAEARVRLGGALMKQGRAGAAAQEFRDGHARHPRDPRFLVNLASALEALHDLDAAETAAQRAQILSPASPSVGLVLGRLAHRRGRLAEARSRLAAALDRPLSEELRAEALFELGHVLDRLGEAPRAFAVFAEANALEARGQDARRFDGRRFLARVAANRAAFTRERLPALVSRAPDDPEAAPVFFVGFPRSGTTLVERALAAHPGVVTTEERSPLTHAVRALLNGRDIPAALAEVDAEAISAARGVFRAEAARLVGPAEGRALVDKLPLNLVDLGFANLLFPAARAIVALRDPRDVCLSCFMQRFRLNDSMAGFLDLRRTAETYAAVMDLWLAYREALTLDWTEVRYEDLVADFEGVLRGLLSFLGLEWDPAVARHREAPRAPAALTPSYRQVGEDLYTRAVGRWRAYRDELAPVLPILQPYVEAFGYPAE